MAAEVDPGIVIPEFKPLVVAIHTEQGRERGRGACQAYERHNAEREEVRLGHLPQGYRCHRDVRYVTHQNSL